MKEGFVLIFGLALLGGCGEKGVERVEWPVMGTIAAVQTRGATPEERSEVIRTVKDEFARVEALLNAHDPNSELSRLAPLDRTEILGRCDKSVRPCYEEAFAWCDRTEGAFNPRWRGPGTLDLGAIAKGFAVDLAAERLKARKLSGDVLVDLGGNLKAVKGAWRVGIARSDKSFTLEERFACATSGEYFRGKHIYDGRTGQAVSNGVAWVTVVSTEAMAADLASTIQFIFGPKEGPNYLDKWRTDSVHWEMLDGSHADWKNTIW